MWPNLERLIKSRSTTQARDDVATSGASDPRLNRDRQSTPKALVHGTFLFVDKSFSK